MFMGSKITQIVSEAGNRLVKNPDNMNVSDSTLPTTNASNCIFHYQKLTFVDTCTEEI